MSETRHYGPGSDEGAENWAMLASPIETCKLHGINPHAYLTVVSRERHSCFASIR
jgi:hypothetical protein